MLVRAKLCKNTNKKIDSAIFFLYIPNPNQHSISPKIILDLHGFIQQILISESLNFRNLT